MRENLSILLVCIPLRVMLKQPSWESPTNVSGFLPDDGIGLCCGSKLQSNKQLPLHTLYALVSQYVVYSGRGRCIAEPSTQP